MTLVIDASIAVKFVVREPGSIAAKQYLESPEPLIAPDWLLVEAASALWNKVRRSELLIVHAENVLRSLPSFFERLHPASELIDEAFKLSLLVRHSVYDCLYLALAVREKCQVVTADEDFYKAAVKSGLGEQAILMKSE